MFVVRIIQEHVILEAVKAARDKTYCPCPMLAAEHETRTVKYTYIEKATDKSYLP